MSREVQYLMFLLVSVGTGILCSMIIGLSPWGCVATSVATFLAMHGFNMYVETGAFNPFRLPPKE